MNVVVRRLILGAGIVMLVSLPALGAMMILVYVLDAIRAAAVRNGYKTAAQIAAEEKRDRERIIAWKSIP